MPHTQTETETATHQISDPSQKSVESALKKFYGFGLLRLLHLLLLLLLLLLPAV